MPAAERYPRRMAKKPRTGGRVTPKGTRPVERSKGRASKAAPEVDHRPVPGQDPAKSRLNSGPVGPTRAGHHHGQR